MAWRVPTVKIGLIGFFGAGAYSDDLIEYTTRRLLLKENPEAEIDYKWRAKCVGGTKPKILNGFDLIIHAGGSLLGKCTHYPIRDIEKWHKKVKTPIAIFGTGYRYEPDKEPLNPARRRRLQLLFEKAEVISLRGYKTMQHLKENGIDMSKVVSVGDPVMACDLGIKEWAPRCVMGNVRHPPEAEVKHAPTENTQKLMAKVYDWLIDFYNVPLTLVSFRNVVGDSDILGCERTMNMMRNRKAVTIEIPKNFVEALNLMRHAMCWFGQRLHPTIFAAVKGVPFVGVEYQFEKMIDWASTLGIDGYIHTEDAKLGDFIAAFEKIPHNTRKFKSMLPKRIKQIRSVAKKIMGLA